MIEIRYQTLFTLRNEPQRTLETFIVAFQLLFGSAENGVVPMAEKLDYKPQHEDYE